MADVNSAVSYILSEEGGLSRATTDTASAHPAPWTYNNKTGWHTNKGIKYQTFSSLASSLGYDNNASNFFSMPQDIWMKIYKHGYWDPMLADQIKSQALANAMVDYAWASGVGGAQRHIKDWLFHNYSITALTEQQVVDAVNKLTANGDKDVFLNFIEFRKEAFIALHQPANQAGWLRRMDDLKAEGLKLVSAIVNNPGSTTAVLFFLGLTAVGYIYREPIKKKVKAILQKI